MTLWYHLDCRCLWSPLCGWLPVHLQLFADHRSTRELLILAHSERNIIRVRHFWFTHYWLNLVSVWCFWFISLLLLLFSLCRETFVCNLMNTYGNYSCSVRKTDVNKNSDIFIDMNSFNISLCHKKNGEVQMCKVLDDNFEPVKNSKEHDLFSQSEAKNVVFRFRYGCLPLWRCMMCVCNCVLSSVKPNAPCCLTVTHNSSEHHFTWKSTYEEYRDLTELDENLKYQLHYYKRGDNVRFTVIININDVMPATDMSTTPDFWL